MSASTSRVRTSAEKQRALLDILENWIPYVEAFWSPSDVAESESDFFFDRDLLDGVEQPRASGAVATLYATLLTAYPTRETFGPTSVPRSTLIAHAEQTMRHELATHDTVLTDPARRVSRMNYAEIVAHIDAEMPTGESKFPLIWPRDRGYVPIDVVGWAWAAHLLWDHLRDDTKAKAVAIVEHEVAWLMAREPSGIENGSDTYSDQNSWHTSLLAIAAVMLPTHPDAEAWIDKLKSYAINSATIAADRSSAALIDGVELRTWATTVNINDDLTLVNHCIFHPSYLMGVYAMFSDSALYLAYGGRAVPEALRFRLDDVWDKVLGPLTTAEGEALHPVSTDWTSHTMASDYLVEIATVLRRDDASALESVLIERLAARQAATTATVDVGGRRTELRGASFFGMTDFGFEADCARAAAMSWWKHELLGPAPTPTEAEVEAARAAFAGVHEYPDAAVTAHVTDASLNVISWRKPTASTSTAAALSVATAQIAPWCRAHEGDEVFVRAIPRGTWGETPGETTGHSCESRQDFFSSAGITSDGSRHRCLSMTSFPDGTVLLLDRGAGTGPVDGTFRFGFERVPGLTGERPVYTADGTWVYDDGDATPSGTWANVADRFGLIVAGGGGLSLTPLSEADPGVGVTPYIRLTGSRDGGSGNRGAIVLPLATHEQTALLAPFVSQPSVSDERWSALTARTADGTARIAVGRWGGAETATISGMTSPLGAPIPDRPEDVTVHGASGSTSVTLDSPASTGWHGCFWVESTRPVTIRPTSQTRIEIANGPSSATVTIRYVDADGALHTAQATLAPDAVAHAHAVDGGVAIAEPA